MIASYYKPIFLNQDGAQILFIVPVCNATAETITCLIIFFKLNVTDDCRSKKGRRSAERRKPRTGVYSQRSFTSNPIPLLPPSLLPTPPFLSSSHPHPWSGTREALLYQHESLSEAECQKTSRTFWRPPVTFARAEERGLEVIFPPVNQSIGNIDSPANDRGLRLNEIVLEGREGEDGFL